LGVDAFQPVLSTRSEYDVLKKWEDKQARWNQIMLSACKQCNTPFLPKLLPPLLFEKALTQDAAPSLIAYEAEQTHTLSWGLAQLNSPKSLRVFVGPAGGWTEEEISLAARCHIPAVTLGVNILRAETACIAVCAKLL
ncbi:MAG: RNA methyltransferase, partial [Elusimicrobiaceae bacterium]|nr:RNA methyltransferase [Elusimicrobiaceae bacterium]